MHVFLAPRRLHTGQPEQRRESSLKFQTRCLRCFTDGQGYALGSVEGRVAMEMFDLGEQAQVGGWCSGWLAQWVGGWVGR